MQGNKKEIENKKACQSQCCGTEVKVMLGTLAARVEAAKPKRPKR